MQKNFYYCAVNESWGGAVFFLLLEAAGDSGMPSLCCGAVVFSAHLSQVLGLAVGTETYTSELRILQGQ